MTRAFDPAVHCGANGKQGGGPCRQPRGYRTDHGGSGNCWLHGGRTPNGEKHAAAQRVEHAIAELGVPRGKGNPFELMTAAVQHAHGHLEATATVVREAAQPGEGKTPKLPLDVALQSYEEAIRIAARTGKATVDADVAARLAALDERASGLLMRFVGELFDRVVPAARRPEIEVWASARLAELAAEYEQTGLVH